MYNSLFSLDLDIDREIDIVKTAEKHSDVDWHNILSALFDVYETLRQVFNYSQVRALV